MFQKIVLLIICLFNLSFVYAQAQPSAKEVLDKTSKMVRGAGGMEVSFTATSFIGKKANESMQGVLTMKGRKFQLTSEHMLSWYDGKTLWSMLRDQDEVNISTPSAQERRNMDPYMFTDLYKNGYTYTMTNVQYKGKSCYEVTLKGAKRDIRQMIITIDKTSYQPHCIRLLDENNRWTRITINQCRKGIKLSDSNFTFPNKDFPTMQIVDLR